MTSQLDVPGIIWLATRGAESMGPYLNDLFAIGKYAEMLHVSIFAERRFQLS